MVGKTPLRIRAGFDIEAMGIYICKYPFISTTRGLTTCFEESALLKFEDNNGQGLRGDDLHQ